MISRLIPRLSSPKILCDKLQAFAFSLASAQKKDVGTDNFRLLSRHLCKPDSEKTPASAHCKLYFFNFS